MYRLSLRDDLMKVSNEKVGIAALETLRSFANVALLMKVSSEEGGIVLLEVFRSLASVALLT